MSLAPWVDGSAGRRLEEGLTLALILGMAALTRGYRLSLVWFTADQIRDVSTASAIAAGERLPLLGPAISSTHASLGPLYFYLLAAPMAISSDPMAAASFVAAANVLAVAVSYFFVRAFFGRRVAVVAAALFATFPLAVVSARGIWNPGLLPLFVVLFTWALFALIVHGTSRAVVPAMALLAILLQLHMTSITLAAVAGAAVVLFRPTLRPRHGLLGMAAFLALLAPYLAYEVSHAFANVRALAAFTAADQGLASARPVAGVVLNALALYPAALTAVVIDPAWPQALVDVALGLHAVEALLFVAGVLLCLVHVIVARHDRDPAATATLRASTLMLLWLAVPVLALASKKTAVWYWYLDVLYPAQFVFAGIALAALATWACARIRRGAVVLAVVVVVVLALTQATMTIALQRRIDRRGELAVGGGLDLSTLGAAQPAVGTATLIPLRYRRDLLRTLVTDFGVAAANVPALAHGVVLGPQEDNMYLLRLVGSARPASAPDSRGLHYLVTLRDDATAGVPPAGTQRVGPYTIVGYRPSIDYRSWRRALSPAGGPPSPADAAWTRWTVPANGLSLDLLTGDALVVRGTVHRTSTADRVTIAVGLIGPDPPADARLAVNGTPLPVASRRQRYAVLSRAVESLFDVTDALVAGDNTLEITVAGPGRLSAFDVYEGGSLP